MTEVICIGALADKTGKAWYTLLNSGIYQLSLTKDSTQSQGRLLFVIKSLVLSLSLMRLSFIDATVDNFDYQYYSTKYNMR